MELMDAIITRRSIRKFKNIEVPDNYVDEILKAAMYAPSARNYQPWLFIVINDRGVLNKIPHVHPYAEMVYEAALAILVCGDRKIEKMDEYIAIDCAAATQNLLLSAHNLGLGAVWLGVYPREKRMAGLSDLVKLPENVIPISLVALGYPGEEITAPERYNRDKIYFNTWGKK
ncbi:nitroreductase family protein [Bacteroidota bacterium]